MSKIIRALSLASCLLFSAGSNASAGAWDIVHVNDLNNRFADCTYHSLYHYVRANVCYNKVMIGCQASGMAYLNYESKNLCT